MGRWIKLFSEFLDWEWFSKPEMVQLFVWLLLNANAKSKNWRGVNVGRGQLVTSLEKMCAGTGLTYQKLRTCLARLKQTGEITQKSTNKFSIITICNYERYQDEIFNEQQTNNGQTTGKQLTNNGQTTTTLDRENNIYNNISTSTTTTYNAPTREERALELFMRQQASLEAFCMTLRITPDEAERYARDILAEWTLQGKEHQSVSDAREHLLHALRAKVNFEHTNNKTKQNDTTERERQDKRRAAEVTATCASSYEGDF